MGTDGERYPYRQLCQRQEPMAGTGNDDYVGGLVGRQRWNSTIIASYASGSVTVRGGCWFSVITRVAWWVISGGGGTISASYATGRM